MPVSLKDCILFLFLRTAYRINCRNLIAYGDRTEYNIIQYKNLIRGIIGIDRTFAELLYFTGAVAFFKAVYPSILEAVPEARALVCEK